MVNFKEELIKLYPILRSLLLIIGICALGFYVLNSFFDWKYKSALLRSPCELCADLNKNQSKCISGCFQIKTNLYPNGFGEWKDIEGNCYDQLNKKTECKNNITNYSSSQLIQLDNLALS